MSSPKTIEAVNRLIGNLLAGGSEIFLPGVGSLYTEQRAAQHLSKRRVLPPYRAVVFSSQQRGVSLVDEITRVAQCPSERAQACYDGWLGICRPGDVLTINGVGTLKGKDFATDEAFDSLLNPQGHKPIVIRPRKRLDWSVWVGIVAILVAAGFGGYEFLLPYSDDAASQTAVAEQPAPQIAADALEPAGVPTSEVSDTIVAPDAVPEVVASAEQPLPETKAEPAVQAPAAQTPAKSAPAQPASDGVSSLVGGRYYVVLGVFSTRENAQRAADTTHKKQPALNCRIYRFGAKFMLSPFDTTDAADAARFVGEHKADFPDAWTYTAR